MSEDDVKEENEEGDTGENNEEEKDKGPSLGDISNSVKAVSDLVTSLGQEVVGLKTQAAQDKADREKPIDPVDEEKDDTNPELLTNAQLLGRVQGMIDKGMSTIADRISEVQDSNTKTSVEIAVKETAAKYDDFWDYRDEMGKISKTTPDLPIEDMYRLAKAQNPEKVEKLKAEKDKLKNGKDEGNKNFGGLKPGGGKTVKEKKMTFEQAADAAWNDAMESSQ